MTHLVGSGKNQIPTNQELGNLAFQNDNIKNLGVGTLTANTVTVDASVTSIRPSLVLDFANFSKMQDYIDPRVTISNGTNKTWIGKVNNAATLRSSTTTPRYELDWSTGEPLGMLCESSSTNHILYSNDFSNAYWVVSGTTKQYTTGFAGANDAIVINDTSTTAYGSLGSTSFTWQPVTNEPITVSAFVKKDNIPAATRYPIIRFDTLTSNKYVDLRFDTKTGQMSPYVGSAGGIVISAYGVIDYGTWWRFWFTCNTTTATTTYPRIALYSAAGNTSLSTTYSPTINGSTTFWGVQVERSAVLSSYIPTTSATVTTNIDEHKITDLSSFYNQNQGTLYVEFMSKDSTAATAVGFESVTGDTDSIRIRVGSTGTLLCQTRVASTDTNSLSTTFAKNAFYKVAYAYKANDFASCINGGIPQTATTGALPNVSYMSIGVEHTGTTPVNSLDGYIKKIAYYPRRLSNTELIELTK